MNDVRRQHGAPRLRIALTALLAAIGIALIAVGVWSLLQKPVKTYRDARLVHAAPFDAAGASYDASTEGATRDDDAPPAFEATQSVQLASSARAEDVARP